MPARVGFDERQRLGDPIGVVGMDEGTAEPADDVLRLPSGDQTDSRADIGDPVLDRFGDRGDIAGKHHERSPTRFPKPGLARFQRALGAIGDHSENGCQRSTFVVYRVIGHQRRKYCSIGANPVALVVDRRRGCQVRLHEGPVIAVKQP